jgi:hypothetical protein
MATACIWYHFKEGHDRSSARKRPQLPDGWYFDGAENAPHADPDAFQERYPMGEVYMGPKSSYDEALTAVMDALDDDKERGAIDEYTFATRAEYLESVQEWKLKYGNRIDDSL